MTVCTGVDACPVRNKSLSVKTIANQVKIHEDPGFLAHDINPPQVVVVALYTRQELTVPGRSAGSSHSPDRVRSRIPQTHGAEGKDKVR